MGCGACGCVGDMPTFTPCLGRYGLVEFPRYLFNLGDNIDRREQMRNRIALAMEAQEDTSTVITRCIANAQKTEHWLDRNPNFDCQEAIQVMYRYQL